VETEKGAQVRVLVAEDERLMADTIATGLRRRSMAVDVCYDGDAALERVTVHRYDVMADALDDALDRLAAGYESQRRFASNASHELRTPLAVQRVLTEVAMEDPDAGQELRRLGVQLLCTNERNERLIEGLLVLAESDRGLRGKIPVQLDELAESVLDAHEELAARHGITMHRKLSERLVPGDPVLLERLITNLVANAIAYNEPGGWVEAEVAVADQPALAVSHSGGVGLGLSIVRSIVAAHEGTVRARPRPEGGLIVEIEFPDLSVAGPHST
jgi:signal transduction histidine kinase